jgi:hypothetical protein
MSEWLRVRWSSFTKSCWVIRVVNAMQRGKEKIIWGTVIRNSINNGMLVKSQDEIFIRGRAVTPQVFDFHICTCISWTWASFIHSWAYIAWNMFSKHYNILLYFMCVVFMKWKVGNTQVQHVQLTLVKHS